MDVKIAKNTLFNGFWPWMSGFHGPGAIYGKNPRDDPEKILKQKLN
jgi:hypothetical protein